MGNVWVLVFEWMSDRWADVFGYGLNDCLVEYEDDISVVVDVDVMCLVK